MKDLVIYCKSYINDVQRVKILLDSINKYNRDYIPFFISVPKTDIKIFKDVLGTEDYQLIDDNEIDEFGFGWVGQQCIKSQFWKLKLCKNYMCIDSDGQFIKDFRVSDFIHSDGIPYTICHEYKEFFEFMEKFPLHFDPYESFKKERMEIMEIFGRTGIIYDFGPIPVIWSCKVWESLFKNYLEPNNIKFSDAIQSIKSEFSWYGEWLLTSKEIPLYPREAIFKSYHYRHQYEIDKQQGMTIEKLSKYYFGIMLNTSWNAPLVY